MKHRLNFNNIVNKDSLILFIILYSSLILGFIFNEDSNGGAYVDYINQDVIVNKFRENFINSFLNYDNFTTRHSPILISLISLLKKINIHQDIIRIIHLHLCLVLPISFYLILENKYSLEIKDKKKFLLITGLIFLSPTFRSLSIWPDSRILGLTFFLISILFFLKFNKKKSLKYVYLNICFYTVASYLSPNFAVFSIFFFYKYLKFFGVSKSLIKIAIINIFLSLPALYYIFYLDINFLNKSAAVNDDSIESIFFNNIFNQILIIPTIFLFYLLPFLSFKIINLNFYKLKKTILISLPFFLISIYFFDYNYFYTGGGIFFKISNFILGNNNLFYPIAFVSIVLIINLIIEKLDNLIIFILLILSNPQITIYHKYYDPLLVCLFFSIFSFKINLNIQSLNLRLVFIYFYFLIFLFMGILKRYI